MNTSWYESDDTLLSELGAALRSGSAVTAPDRAAMLMAGYDLVTADFVEAELLFDSLTTAGAHRCGQVSRATPVALQPRTMTFGAS